MQSCKVGRLPPLAPPIFERMLREGMAREQTAAGSGIVFTNGRDATNICIPQYHEGFLRLMAARGMLSFGSCGWGDAEIEQLATALLFAHDEGATTQAFQLFLAANRVTDAGLMRIIETITAGAMPNLNELVLTKNELTDVGLAALVPLLSDPRLSGLKRLGVGSGLTESGAQSLVALTAGGHLSNLKRLFLNDNPALGDAGTVFIAGILSAGRLQKLEQLYLDGTGMGDVGAAALAEALGGAPALSRLFVGQEAAGNVTLQEACAERGVKLFASHAQEHPMSMIA